MSSDSKASSSSIKVYITTDDEELVQPEPTQRNTAAAVLAKRVMKTFRTHLLRRSNDGSISKTLRTYIGVLGLVHEALDPSSGQSMPTEYEVVDYLTQAFPEVWLGGGQRGLFNDQCWAVVDPTRPSHMMIWMEVFVLLEKRSTNESYRHSGIELDYDQVYHLVVHIVAHELMHCLVHHFFGAAFTPQGPQDYDKESNTESGESGWQLEWSLFGGGLVIQFEEGDACRWDLSRVQAVLFELPNGKDSYNISSHSEATSAVIRQSIKRKSSIPHIDPALYNLPLIRDGAGNRQRVAAVIRSPPSPTRLPATIHPTRPTSLSKPDILTHRPGLRHRNDERAISGDRTSMFRSMGPRTDTSSDEVA